jgi:hypothetical protein
MNDEAADRMSAAAGKDPDSPTATSGFEEGAQDAADRNARPQRPTATPDRK